MVLRQLERWLHQHLFKVGWLVTRSFQTTTILYYTFFLPGVFLHELSYWLSAGILNVQAKSSIQWPEPQEIAELDLSFVELAKNTPPAKLALITLAPIISGLLAVWLIANNILQFNSFFDTLATGKLTDVAGAVRDLASAPDFWLWIYLLFTISNTMIPRLGNLRGLRRVLIGIGIVVVLLFLIGAGSQIIFGTLAEPLTNAVNLLSATFFVIICIDLFFVIFLGTIEAIIERITGHSATFRRGKLIAMTREEAIEARRRQQQRETRALQSRSARQPTMLSIYDRQLAIPGAPGDEAVTQSETVIVETEQQLTLPQPDDRKGPDLITGAAINATSSRPTPALPEKTTSSDEPDTNDTSQSPKENDDEQEDETEDDMEKSV